MVPKRVNYSPNAPAINLVPDWPNYGSTRGDGPCNHSVRIRNDQDHSHGAASQRLGAEIEMFG
jgi:hypothetical protein